MKKKYIFLNILSIFALQNIISSMEKNIIVKDINPEYSAEHADKTLQLVKLLNKLDKRHPVFLDSFQPYQVDEKDSQLMINLINDGADVNATDRYGTTPLMWAAILNDKNMAELFISKGADIRATNISNVNALTYAAHFLSVGVAKLLIDKGININATDKHGYTALISASNRDNNYRMMKLLIDKGANVNIQDDKGNTALIIAARADYTGDVVDLLIRSGAQVNLKNKEDLSALISALYNRNTKEYYTGIIKSLIKAGANINDRNPYNGSIASEAIRRHYGKQVAHELLDRIVEQ